MNISINSLTRFAFTYYIALIMLNTFLAILGIDADLLIYYPPMLLIFIKGFSYVFKNNGNVLKIATMFLAFLLFSIVLYAINGTPLDCYLSAITQTIFPLLFVYLGYKYSVDDEFNKWLLYGCAFCFIVGVFFYITTPPFYVHYLADLRDQTWYSNMAADENTIMESFRFSALFGDSYLVSYFSIPTLALSLSALISKRITKNKVIIYIIVLSSFVSAILCQQRIAIAFALIVPLFYAFYSLRHGNGSSLLIAYIATVVIILISLSYLGTLERYAEIKDLVLDRFSALDFHDAMSERTDQYTSFNRQTSWSLIVGLGLGSCGGHARAAGLVGVTDGWFVKLYYESGIIGVILFVALLLPTLIRGLKMLKWYHAELMIIVYFLAACLGADALSATIPTAIFWYCIGRIWNPVYYNNLKNRKLIVT